MLGLPKQTEFNKIMPKEAFYQKGDFSAAEKELFVAQIARITWAHKLSPRTINLEANDGFAELQVLHIALKQQAYNTKILSIMQKMIPYHIVFVLSFEGQARLAVHQTKWIEGEWQLIDDLQLPLKGLTLEKAWENLVVEIGEVTLEQGNTLDEQIAQTEEQKKLLAKIEALERKMRNTKQFNQQVKIKREIKKLKKLLEVR